MFQPMSVVDVGCGPGNMLKELQDRGARQVLGIDAPQRMQEILACAVIDEACYRWVDLRQPPDRIVGPQADLCISVEVAEHLPAESAPAYLNYLKQWSSTLLFSAAYPGQTGHGHINEQPFEWWFERWAALGVTWDMLATDQLQNMVRGKVASCFWYENLHVYRTNR